MPTKSRPPAPAGTVPPTPPKPARAYHPALAKGTGSQPPRGAGFTPRGKSANRLIHAQKPRGR